ncbi:MAG: HD domain-containing protein [Planctomycetaceae bacterium]|nr:HD domain-containing protein [Planctomycetaceae bacterium]
MSRQFIEELKDGDTIEEVFLLADKQLRANRNANLYLLTQLRDRTGTVSGLMWNVTEETCADFDAGDFVHVRGKVQVFQGGLQAILTRVDRIDSAGLNSEDFEFQPPQDVNSLFERMKEILLAIKNAPIRTLMESFLLDEAIVQKLLRTGAGVKAHHAYPGGLVEHICNMLEVSDRIRDLYATVDFDLVQAGIFLHDLGKVREMDFENAFVYTDEGQLLGHMSIAVEMVTEKITQVELMMNESFPRELELRIKHMILSHHGSYAHGSPRLPMTPEAAVLHQIDNLDAKVYEFVHTIEDDPNGESHWTPYLPRIERKLYKGPKTSK